ncbi:YbaN family protein [Marinomonas lutimaris]|uniref:YbaN family protein n=1 Tax=Marinomonas lutimaris TaxID=2846746 RepID=UPI003211AEA4
MLSEVNKKGKRLFYQIIAVLSLIMAFVGVLVPGIPATEFILLCAWSSSKGSPRIHRFLNNNRFTGPTLYNWKNGKVISKNNKILSSLSMMFCACLLFYSNVNVYLVFFAISGMFVGFIWMWSRPEEVKNLTKEC